MVNRRKYWQLSMRGPARISTWRRCFKRRRSRGVAQNKMLASLEADGLLRIEEGVIRLNRVGKPLVDSIAVALLG